jgi:hypothetical protein
MNQTDAAIAKTKRQVQVSARLVVTSDLLTQDELVTALVSDFYVVATIRNQDGIAGRTMAEQISAKYPASFIIESENRWYVCQPMIQEGTK